MLKYTGIISGVMSRGLTKQASIAKNIMNLLSKVGLDRKALKLYAYAKKPLNRNMLIGAGSLAALNTAIGAIVNRGTDVGDDAYETEIKQALTETQQ